MELTRREGLQVLAALSAVLASGGLVACGNESGRRAPEEAGSSGLARSDVARSPGSAQALPEAVASVSALAGGLYGSLAARGNVALSPYSVAVALAMTLNGARGETAAQMRGVLHATDLRWLNAGMAALALHLEGLAGVTRRVDGSRSEIALDTANALFGQRDTVWRRPFLDDLARSYGAGIRLVDYEAATEAARALINTWTAGQTRDRIPEIVPAGVLDAMTRLVLVNAIYLKAPWEEPFEPSLTRRRPFTTDAGRAVVVDMMTAGLATAGWGGGDGWQAVRLAYAGGTLAMTVVVPAQGRLDELSAAVTHGGLTEILAAPRPGGVLLSLPRWTFRTQVPLKEVLVGLGMRAAFDKSAADFSGMTREVQLYVSAVLHEAFVAVDEKGTEAAAATAVVMRETSAPLFEHEVVVDRPFLFVIHDVEHLTPLFVGRVTDPTA